MFCANCGTKNEDGAMFCAGCGQKLEVAPAPAAAAAPVEFNGLEDEATVAAYFNPATGVTTPVAPAPVAPAPEVVAQPVAPAPAPEVYAQPVAPAAPVAPAPEAYAQPVAPAAPVAPAPEAYAQPVAPAAPVAPAPEAYAQPVAPAAPVTPAAPAEKKPVNKLPFIIIGAVAAVVVIIIIIVAAVNLGGSSSGSKYTAEWNSWFSVEDEVTYFAYGDDVFKDTIDGNAYIEAYSMDQTIIVAYNSDDEYFLLTTKGKITSLGESLTSISISQDSSTIAYVDEDDTLYTYKVSNGSTSKIAEDVYSAVLSPSGKSVAYEVDDDGTYKMFVYNGKKETELSKNAEPIGLTDDCKYIYYYDSNKDALYVTNLKDDSNKIESDVNSRFVFNSDHTEIMFTSDNGLFVSVKGGDKQKISGKSSTPYYVGLYADYIYAVDNVSGALTYNLKSFKNNYYFVDDTIVYIDSKWSGDKAISNVYGFDIADDLKTIYYRNDSGTLYLSKLDGKYESTKIKSDVSSFGCTNDGSGVYFVVDDDALYYQKGKSDNVKIATDVYSMSVSSDGIVYFTMDYDSDDSTATLYYSKAGKDKQKVASDVYSFYCDINTVIYYDNYESDSSYDDVTYVYSYYSSYDVNMASKGTKFNKILEDIGYSYSY